MNCVVIAVTLLAAEPKPDEAALLKTFRDEFVAITPGQGRFPAEFQLGEGAAPDQKSKSIKLAGPFAIAKYEITQELWEAVMGSNPSRWKGARNSLEMMSRLEADQFCRRVTEKLRAAKLIDAKQTVALPSEAQWEYCARAGTTTRYSFGDDVALLDKHAWHTGNAAGNDPPVGAKAANPWGLYDLHGYLWELCADDWTANVAELPADGGAFVKLKYSQPAPGVVRGGSWKDAAELLTSGSRRELAFDARDDAVGLRCVLLTEP